MLLSCASTFAVGFAWNLYCNEKNLAIPVRIMGALLLGATVGIVFNSI